MAILNARINTILPIAISIILPGLGIYANLQEGVETRAPFLVTWAVASAIFFAIWHFFWRLWDLKLQPIYKLLMVLLIIVLITAFGITLGPEVSWGRAIFRLTMGIVLMLTIQFALKAQSNIAKISLEKEQLQTQNYKVELQALRAKVDPHFLFNSLNTLRSMVRQQHGNAEQFVMSLSDFYRRTLKHNENTSLPLSEELVVLESYLFLMKSRNEAAVELSVEIDPKLHHYKLPAMALQTVVENCFKHNSMTSKKPLHIDVYSDHGDSIVITNNIQPKISSGESSGLGLELLKKRYELMGEANALDIEEDSTQFTVKLKLIKD
jgi:two-component system LytT family sensor kinase